MEAESSWYVVAIPNMGPDWEWVGRVDSSNTFKRGTTDYWGSKSVVIY